jgi:hypothetical protein
MKPQHPFLVLPVLLATLALPAAPAFGDGAPAINFDDLGMNISHAEREAIVSAIHSAREISRVAETKNGRPFRRDAHAKATGCLRATFTVNGDIPARFQHSVFSEPGREYPSWIRFSNGNMLVKPDSEGDARGMAVKLMGVEDLGAEGAGVEGMSIAPELHPPGASAKTQDFVMTNVPAFFNRNIFDYAENATYLARFEGLDWFVNLWPPRLHAKELYRAAQTVSTHIESPLAVQYFSMLPYQLGNTTLKFSTRPCAGAHFTATSKLDSFDFLTDQMAATLASNAACFEFMVQPKIAGADMPIEDGTAIWSEQESAFIPIATIRIPPQTFTGEPQQQFCENLSMNPWHGVGEWTPVGSLNRARRLVYNAVSEFRHRKNEAPREEPRSWCVPGADAPCTDANDQGLIVSKPRWPLPRCFDHAYQPVEGSPVASQCGPAGETAQGY